MKLKIVMPQTNETQSLTRTTQRIQRYSELLDNKFVIPGTKIRFGWDAIIGLIPGIGDAISLCISLLIIVDAVKLKTPRTIILRMLINLVFEFLVGIIPIFGDVFDVYWKANIRNLDLLQPHLAAITPKEDPTTVDIAQKNSVKGHFTAVSGLILFAFLLIIALLAYKINTGV